jgi:ankyrin repeat protein
MQANVNVQDNAGRTPLMWAIKNRRQEAVSPLACRFVTFSVCFCFGAVEKCYKHGTGFWTIRMGQLAPYFDRVLA